MRERSGNKIIREKKILENWGRQIRTIKLKKRLNKIMGIILFRLSKINKNNISKMIMKVMMIMIIMMITTMMMMMMMINTTIMVKHKIKHQTLVIIK